MFELAHAGAVFRTSGTTGGGRGTHRLLDTFLYDRGALAWALRCAPDLPADVIALLEDPALATDSSLSHMVGLFPRATGRAVWHVIDGNLDVEGATASVRAAKGPVLLASTAFALAEWLEGDVPPLPPGSLVMVTGGFKGRAVRLSDEALYGTIDARLRPHRTLTEYGMTELSSQLYEETLRRRGGPAARGVYQPPPWLRVVAVDAATLEPLPAGVVGLGRFVDLANVDSAVAIQTADRVRVSTGGGVELFGREPGATPRGCSLAVEEITAGGAGSADPVSTDAPHREPSP